MLDHISNFCGSSGGRSVILAFLVCVGGALSLLGEKDLGHTIASHSFFGLCILIEPSGSPRMPVKPVIE